MKIKNVIFDFGGVLIDWNPRYLYNDLFEDKEDMEWFLANVCSPDWNEQQDAGRSLKEATEILVKQFPSYESLIRKYYDHWEIMISGAIDDNVEVLYQLKDRYRLFGLSNWSGETFPIAFKRYPFFGELEGIVISGDEKMIKPDEAIYQLILERYDLKAEESLFIDDNANNIEAARKLGFPTVHFNGEVVLDEELKKRNLL